MVHVQYTVTVAILLQNINLAANPRVTHARLLCIQINIDFGDSNINLQSADFSLTFNLRNLTTGIHYNQM